MTLSERLSEYVRACFTGIWIKTFEPDDALQEIARLCRQQRWTLASWDIDRGLGLAGQSGEADPVTLRHQFRRWPGRLRAEAIAEARAAAWHAWYGLLRRGKDPLAVGPTGIAFNATRYVKGGRKLGCGAVGRSAVDVYDRRARRLGLTLVSLDREVGEGPGQESDAWREWLAEDNRVSPADEAAFRIDFAAWLETLPTRKRRIAEFLAEGHETSVGAGLVGVSPGRVSQIRSELAGSWREFQAQAV